MKIAAISHHFPSLSDSNRDFKKPHRRPSIHSCNSLSFHERIHVAQHVVLQSSFSSSSSSFSHVVFVSSSSSAEFPGQLVDEEAEKMVIETKKKKRIAGIDQDELVEDPALLADPDSCFCEFRGVKIHYKICDSELHKKDESLESQVVAERVETKRVGLPMILLHGFGASVFSWNRVMKALAEVVGSKVLSFDRPAFGLTSRMNLSGQLGPGNAGDTKTLNPYSTAFSVLATLYFIDLLGAEKAIIVGHSAGSLVAVNSYFKAPERIAALILVAPAIFAPLTSQKEVTKGNQSEGDKQIQEGGSKNNSLWNSFVQLCSVLFKSAKFVLQAIMRILTSMADMLHSLYKKLLSAVLRSALAVALVRMIIDKFGIMAVKYSWYNSKLVTDHVLDGYTKPLRTKGWDRALIEYTAALLTDTAPETKPPLSKRLREISCPVLIVTGDNDRLVPAWNAERLSRVIPGSCFEVIKQCGHLPHEEKVDEFISVVQKFLQKAFGDSAKQH